LELGKLSRWRIITRVPRPSPVFRAAPTARWITDIAEGTAIAALEGTFHVASSITKISPSNGIIRSSH
jgi:hypothetical protein